MIVSINASCGRRRRRRRCGGPYLRARTQRALHSYIWLHDFCVPPQLSSLVLANNRLDGPYPVSLARQSLVELTLTGNPLQQACPLSRTMTCLMDRMPPYVVRGSAP